MAEQQKESSVLFSLKELMNLEEDRIKQEETERKRQADAASQARMDTERRQRDEEEARMNAEENRRRSEEQRMREDVARVEAIRHAEIEKARLDAENAARMEQLRHHHEHERHITALTQDKHKKRLTLILAVTGVTLLAAIIGGGLFIKKQSDEQQRAAAAAQAEIAEARAQVDKLNSQLKDQTDNINNLQSAVDSAKDEAALRAAKEKLAEAQRQAAATRQAIGNAQRNASTGGGTKTTERKACNCPPGDPLCSCIP